MKTLLSIIVALALLFAFSMPAMASTVSTNDHIIVILTVPAEVGADNSAHAEGNDSVAMTNPSNMFNDNRAYSDSSVVADAYLAQVNTMTSGDFSATNTITNTSGNIDLTDSLHDLTGIANANLGTGALNNQAIQNTFAISAAVEVDSP
jgi:hypothetical protein